MTVGHGVDACTAVVERSLPFQLEGRQVTIVDTPGFDDTTKSDTEILKTISEYLAKTYREGKKLSGIVYLHRISDQRMAGSSTRSFELFRQLCGESTLRNVLIVTSMWDLVTEDVGSRREQQMKTDSRFFAPAISAGATLLRHSNTKASAETILRQIIGNTPLPLQIQKEMVDQNRPLNQTGVGSMLFAFEAQEEKHRQEKEELKRQMENQARLANERLQQEVRNREAALQRARDEKLRLEREQEAQRQRWERERLERERQKELERQEWERGQALARAKAQEELRLARERSEAEARREREEKARWERERIERERQMELERQRERGRREQERTRTEDLERVSWLQRQVESRLAEDMDAEDRAEFTRMSAGLRQMRFSSY